MLSDQLRTKELITVFSIWEIKYWRILLMTIGRHPNTWSICRVYVKPKALDLFAGPGGLSLGLTLSGFNVVGAIEWDHQAGRTYRHNIGEHAIIGDIRELPPKDMEKHLKENGHIKSKKDISLISGGPPCPGFSLVGRSKIANLIKRGEWDGTDSRHSFIDDPRNHLFKEFVSYVRHFKPKRILMENVMGMTSYKDKNERPIISVIKHEFEDVGYKVSARVLDASDFGVPQSRKRVIFLGTLGEKQAVCYPKKSGFKIPSRSAIRDLPKINPLTGMQESEKLSPLRWRGTSGRFLRWIRESETPSGIPPRRNISSLHKTRPVNPRDRAIFPLINSGEKGNRTLYKDIFPNRLDEVEELLPNGYSLVEEDNKKWVVGPSWGRRKDSRWGWYDPTKFGDKMRRIRGDLPAPTIVAHLSKDGYMFIHPDQDRTITVREAARLQSFPDAFDFSAAGANPTSSQFRQIGNAVPPLMALAIGGEIIQSLGMRPEMTIFEIFNR